MRGREVRMAALGHRVPMGSWERTMAMGPEGRKDRLAAWGRLESRERMAGEGPCLGRAGRERRGREGS